MGKRKRDLVERPDAVAAPGGDAKKAMTSAGKEGCMGSFLTIQVVVGTYEKVLHGVQATMSRKINDLLEKDAKVEFADTFLLSPHGSAIRCLAISPSSSPDSVKSRKLVLASGSSDQVINLYHISSEAQRRQREKDADLPTLSGNKIVENTRNRELGSLQHHAGSINALHFPTRSKLLSGAEDNIIAVARTRDWTVLSTIKAPLPKAHGRPSGDTAPLGGTPAGINDFAIHPSMKLMVSVGKGEKCMRLWNLVTGKKAGVLNFERNLLQGVGEGRWASGEGRRVEWNGLGEEFVVGFERGCIVFGMDCQPKCRIVPSQKTKIHQVHYAAISTDTSRTKEVLVVCTEDGRLLFYWTSPSLHVETIQPGNKDEIPLCEAFGQLGGVADGMTGRIKDFEILSPPESTTSIIVTGSSDGAIRLWLIDTEILAGRQASLNDLSKKPMDTPVNGNNTTPEDASVQSPAPRKIGRLLGTYEAGNRITCLKAFVMSEPEEFAMNGLSGRTKTTKADDVEANEESSTSI